MNESKTHSGAGNRLQKFTVLSLAAIGAVTGYWALKEYLSLEVLAAREQHFHDFYASYPMWTLVIAFLIYFFVTGLSIPAGATLLTLVFAWFFQFTTAFVLISFASTAGATLAFLLSRYLFRDWVQQKFGQRLIGFQQSLDREGAFYLFTLRLVPIFPFFAINVVMGLTHIKATTFWWVSQLGMLAGTAVFCYIGAAIPDLQTLQEKGTAAVFNQQQLTQIFIGFALLGLFPLAAKKMVDFLKQNRPSGSLP